MGVLIWDTAHPHSMDGWALSGAVVQAPQHGVLETVWLPLRQSSAGWMPARMGMFSAGVGHIRHPFTIRKASLMEGSIRRAWALRQQTGAQYSEVERTMARVAVRRFVAPAPQPEPASRLLARRVMSASCEVTQGVGDTWATCPTLLRGFWARSRRSGFLFWSWLFHLTFSVS